ncbi:MAG: 4Fe-4S binding protein, partial [Pirellulales bacterium]
MNPKPDVMRGNPKTPGYDLLRLRWFRAIYLSPVFLYVVQAILLGIFVWLAVFGWGRFAPEGVPAKQFAKTNIVNLLIWGMWWPTMVWFSVLFGRVWCAICPLELVANATERSGRRLGVKQRGLRGWLRSGFLIV